MMNKRILTLFFAVLFGFSIVSAQPIQQMLTSGDNYENVEYKNFDKEKLPQSVKNALSKDYAGYKVVEAYCDENGNYKLKVVQADQKYNLYYTSKGILNKVEDALD